MVTGFTNFQINHSAAQAELPGNFLDGQPFGEESQKYCLSATRHFGQGPLEHEQLRFGFGFACRIWSIIRQIERALDVEKTQDTPAGP